MLWSYILPLKLSAYHLQESLIPGGFQRLEPRSISVPAFGPVDTQHFYLHILCTLNESYNTTSHLIFLSSS